MKSFVYGMGVVLGLGVLGSFSFGCEGAEDVGEEEIVPLGANEPLGKEDGTGVMGLPLSADSSSSRVWEVLNQWEDTDTVNARAAGLAWEENSGLNWDEKFAHWAGSLKQIDVFQNDYSQTFEITTPWGKTLPAPKLDCADVAYFLRVLFASWYNLPFYVEAVDYQRKVNGAPNPTYRKRIFFGHFGIRTKMGNWRSMPNFTSRYKDHSDLAGTMSPEALRANWPQDSKLRRIGVFNAEKDHQEFLFEGARLGTYLDEVLLNKRVGYFMRLTLLYTGTPNLADSRNTFNLVPDALQTGDFLLFRRASNGSGHTQPVMRVVKADDGKLRAEVASGNDPPRQPRWNGPAASKREFTSDEGGGPSKNSKDEIYSHLGGGLKRWRVAKKMDGYWMNTFMRGDEAHWINNTDYDRIAARPEMFDQLLGEPSPAEKVEVLLKVITDARNHLRNYPASCAARKRREKAFKELYWVNSSDFDMDYATTDRTYRIREDYVFAELDYEHSKTCCWNSSNSAMFDSIMAYVIEQEQQADTCAPPAVFMFRDGGYEPFQSYAQEGETAYLWRSWSEDESCPQRDVTTDKLKEGYMSPAPYCTLDLSDAPSVCGDNQCRHDETCESCAQDCGACPIEEPEPGEPEPSEPQPDEQ